MEGNLPVLAGLLLYLIVMLAVGLAASRHMKSLDDFVLGGRRLGPWVAAISERASGESAWFLLGLPGAAYVAGFTEYWSVIGIAFGILASWTFIALPLRRATAKYGALTLPDYLEARFKDRSRTLRVLSMVVILAFYTAYVAAQLYAAGTILNALFEMPIAAGILIGAAIVVSYTLLGGFLAVAWTDLIQGLMMTFVAVVLPITAIVKLGGFGALLDKLSEQGPGMLSMWGSDGASAGAAVLFGIAMGGIGWGFGYLGQPHLLTRYMAIREAKEIPQGSAIAMGWVLLSYWGAPFIGLAGLAILGPNLENPEQVMPLLATTLMPGWLAGLMIAGAIAAMMSTADSQLLVATSTIVEDVYVKLMKPKTTPGRLVLISRLVTVAIAAVALTLALKSEGKGIIYSTVDYAWAGLAGAFGPALLLGLWWKRTTRSGALAGMVVGMTATIAWKNVAALQAVIDIKVASFMLAFVAVVTVSLMTSVPADDP
jgi:sodium/proline symporter